MIIAPVKTGEHSINLENMCFSYCFHPSNLTQAELEQNAYMNLKDRQMTRNFDKVKIMSPIDNLLQSAIQSKSFSQ